MLWFDNNPKASFVAKLERAANYYKEKYGLLPTRCEINKTLYDQVATEFLNDPLTVNPTGSKEIPPEMTVMGIEVTGVIYITPNHFWLNPVKLYSSFERTNETADNLRQN